jgi:LysR family transcriptional regulator, nitrogen assimilation regulatory protein
LNLRRLKYFVRIVDIGSLTQASEILFIAQPALSQQLAKLEAEFGRQLLLRTKTGVTPTEAGTVLYRHAQLMLKQFEQAQADVRNSGKALAGQVSVGLASGTAATALAMPLLKAVRARHPRVVLYLNESLGTTLCDQVSDGRMDLAVLYGGRPTGQGLQFDALLREQMVLVVPTQHPLVADQIAFVELRDVELLLPRAHNPLRQYIDEAFSSVSIKPRVVAEIESAATLSAAVANNIAATVLPLSAAQAVAGSMRARIIRLVSPVVEVPLALCTSDHLPLSEPAQAVRAIILELIGNLELGVVAMADD